MGSPLVLLPDPVKVYLYMNIMWNDNFEELLRPQVHRI